MSIINEIWKQEEKKIVILKKKNDEHDIKIR